MTIGIAGKYCSGKDSVVRILKKRGFGEINVDRIGYSVLNDLKSEVVNEFGPGIQTADGEIDRRKLGKIVFSDPVKLEQLEKIIHPEMIKRVKVLNGRMTGQGNDTAVNAAILFEMGLHRLCHFILFVRSPVWQRFLRARKRDGLSAVDVYRRLTAQKRINPKTNESEVDIYYIDNRKNLSYLEMKVADILTQKGFTKES